MNHSRIATSVATALLLSSISTQAENNTNTLIVTANKVEQNINDTLAIVEVVSREDIERLQPQSITELLKTIAGIDVANTGGHGQTSSLFTRGANSNQTLILVDGIRVGSATLGGKELNVVPIAQIERIEIVKGPRAALWGSDAIGGVIQIFTRRLDHGNVHAGLTLGSNDTLSGHSSIGFGNDKITNTLTIANAYSKGFNVREETDFFDLQPDRDGYRKLSAALRGDYQLADDLLLDWVAQKEEGNREFDSSFGGNESDFTNEMFNIRYSYTSDKWFSQLAVKHSLDSTVDYGNGLQISDGSVFETRRKQINGLLKHQTTSDLSITGALEWYEDNVAYSTTEYEQQERETQSAFLNGIYNDGTFISELAIRHDDIESVDRVNTFNASFGYQLNETITFAVNRAKGFKAPSFNDLYFPFGGNSELKPEKAYNTEFNIKAYFEGLSLVFSHYESNVTDLIQWTPDSNGNWSPQNVNEVEIKGQELTVFYKDDYLNHKWTATYNDARDKATDSQLIRRAKQYGSYELSTNYSVLNSFVRAYYTGSRIDGGTKLKGYTSIDLGLIYTVNNNIDINLNINDFFDDQKPTASGYFVPGREFYLTVTYRH
ncbi:TonB-dependent receptor domain-containing protein [Pleionea sediminis]|uniref:TonB-dependent receptor domain-containing protein n=1 Tax=Pleionea sediminis TaxID=2569479 RepID=UPI001185A484|nr:TonB-dependent receptor [Pleionea sediminis]